MILAELDTFRIPTMDFKKASSRSGNHKNTYTWISECSKSHYCHKVLRGNCYYFRKSRENHKKWRNLRCSRISYVYMRSSARKRKFNGTTADIISHSRVGQNGWMEFNAGKRRNRYVRMYVYGAVVHSGCLAYSTWTSRQRRRKKKRGKETFFINLWHTFPRTWTAFFSNCLT